MADMNFAEFVKLNLKVWNQYFRTISSLITQKKMALWEGWLLFPNMALFTETRARNPYIVCRYKLLIYKLFVVTNIYGLMFPDRSGL